MEPLGSAVHLLAHCTVEHHVQHHAVFVTRSLRCDTKHIEKLSNLMFEGLDLLTQGAEGIENLFQKLN